MLFRGTSNLLNAVTVPLMIALTIRQMKPAEIATFIMALLALSLIFFRFQIFFILLYLLLAVAILFAKKHALPFLMRTGLLTFSAAAGFYIVVKMTDLVFGSPLERVLTALAGGNTINFLLLLLAQGVFAGVSLAALTKVRQFDL